MGPMEGCRLPGGVNNASNRRACREFTRRTAMRKSLKWARCQRLIMIVDQIRPLEEIIIQAVASATEDEKFLRNQARQG